MGTFLPKRDFVQGPPDRLWQSLTATAASRSPAWETSRSPGARRAKNGASIPMRFAATSAFNHPFVRLSYEISPHLTLKPGIAPRFQIPRRGPLRSFISGS